GLVDQPAQRTRGVQRGMVVAAAGSAAEEVPARQHRQGRDAAARPRRVAGIGEVEPADRHHVAGQLHRPPARRETVQVDDAVDPPGVAHRVPAGNQVGCGASVLPQQRQVLDDEPAAAGRRRHGRRAFELAFVTRFVAGQAEAGFVVFVLVLPVPFRLGGRALSGRVLLLVLGLELLTLPRLVLLLPLGLVLVLPLPLGLVLVLLRRLRLVLVLVLLQLELSLALELLPQLGAYLVTGRPVLPGWPRTGLGLTLQGSGVKDVHCSPSRARHRGLTVVRGQGARRPGPHRPGRPPGRRA